MLTPLEAIEGEGENVWLTSFYGFTPDTWGLVPFTRPGDRDSFVRRTEPGALVVVYGTGPLPSDKKGMILGVLQVSHEVGPSSDFIGPREWASKQSDPDDRGKWNHGVRAINAWALAPEDRISVGGFATESYWPARARHIGSRGVALTKAEALQLLDLDFYPVSVFDGPQIETLIPETGRKLFRPSRAVPQSQAPFMSREAEGPKHLYVLKLGGSGCPAQFIGVTDLEGDVICKVGYSLSPATRRDAHNKHLPRDCAYHWEVMYSTRADGRDAFDCSQRARAGEDEMKLLLDAEGTSLGGEFFRARPSQIEAAYREGITISENWQP